MRELPPYFWEFIEPIVCETEETVNIGKFY